MKVTVVIKTNEGGAWLVPQLVELRSRGAEIVVVLPPGHGSLRARLDTLSFATQDSPFDFSFRPRASLLRDLWRFRKLVRSTSPDVIFYHLYASALAVRLVSATTLRRPATVHMVAGPLYLENAFIRRLERFLCRLDDVLIAGSDFTRRAYAELGMPAHRLTAIPYGVDTERFSPSPSIPHPRSAARDRFVAVMVAYVYAPKSSVFPGVGIKGHDVLLTAWSKLARERPNCQLLLVGSGFDAAGEDHRRLLQSSPVGRQDSVRWIPTVDDVRQIYDLADVSVSPSLSENHGAALEAGAMGVPSIVSDAGGLPETVTETSGWVTRAGDVEDLHRSLREAFDAWESGRLASMGSAARSHIAASFDLSTCVKRVANVIADVA